MTTPSSTKTVLSDTDLRTLDQLRQRLSQLTVSLNSLQASLRNSSDILPPPASLATQTAILTSHLAAYQSMLTASAPLLSRLAIYLPATFPAGDGEKVGLVQNLLRKKLGEGAEAWVEEGLVKGRGFRGEGGGVGMEDWGELWAWAGPEANRFARRYSWGVGGVGEEEEGEDGKDEEDEDEEEDEEVGDNTDVMMVAGGEGMNGVVGKVEVDGGEVTKPLHLEEVMTFMSTGRRPGG